MSEFVFPDKAKNSLPNLIREVINRGAGREDFVSFALGNPAAEAIPVKEILEAAAEVFAGDPMTILQYGPLVGYDKLREWIIDRLVNVKHFPKEGQSVILLSGSAQGLGLAPRTLCSENDEVYTDEFAFTNALNAIKNAGCRLVGIPMDEYGMIPEELEKAAMSGKGKYVYLIPNFHNPTGMTIPLERRKELYQVARKCGLLIYEDDPYGEIRFKGEHIPAFKSFDEDGRVIYAGSFSKTLSAGLRVGYLYGSQKLLQTMQLVKNSMDGQCSLMNQIIVEKSLERLDFEEYLKGVCRIYGEKCQDMLDALHEYCHPEVKIHEPEGGMFIWITMPDSVDCLAMYEEAIKIGVGIVRSQAFAANSENPGHSFRLNYTFQPREKMLEGVKRLGKLTWDILG